MRHATARKTLVLAAAALTASLLPARAGTTLTWDADLVQPGAQGGPGTWADAAGGWFNGTGNVAWNNANLDSALIAGTAAGTVNLSGTVVAQFVNFNTVGYTLTGGTLTFGTGAGIDSGVHANADVTINSTILTAPGVDGWLKDGPGTLTLGGNNTASAIPFHIHSGAVAIAGKANIPHSVMFDGDATSRLLFTSPAGDTDISATLNVSTTANLDVQNPAAGIGYIGEIRGAGLVVKEGPGTLSPTYPNAAFTGTFRVNAGTLLFDRAPASNARPVQLIGGTLSLQNNTATNFGSNVTARAGTGNTVALAVGGTTAPTGTNTAHALPSLSVISGTLSVTSTNNWGLTVNSVTNNGTIDLNNTRLTVTSSLTAFVGNLPGAVRFAHDPSATPNTSTRGLWLATGSSTTVTSTLAGQTEDADLLVGSTPSGTVATNLTLDGSWRGGGSGSTNTLVLPPKGNITFGPNLRFNNLPTDPAAAPRPLRVWGNSSSLSGTLTLDPAFVADHTNNGAVPEGFADVELSDVTLETQSSQGLPIVTRHLPGSSGTYRAGLIAFDNFSNASAINRWTVKSNDQTYDGGVWVKYNATIYLQKSLTHTGRVGPYADNTFQLAASRTLNVFGAGHALRFSGDLGFAPGSRLIGNDALLVFDTDPGAGWYAGNYARDAGTGAITTPPTPAHTLGLSVGINQGPGGAIFNAPVTRLADLAVAGTTVASLSLPGPQKVLSVANRLSFGTATVANLDLTDNAMILGASSYHTPATVRAMLTGGSLRSSAADADHALGYARAADVRPAAPDGSYPFLGLRVAADDVLVRYTVLGDATLDGTVNFDDLLALAKHYNAASDVHWSSGDFNYDNSINFDDLLILAKHYNASLPTAPVPSAPAHFSQDLAAAFASVPEPSTPLLSIAACGFALSARRRRRATDAPSDGPPDHVPAQKSHATAPKTHPRAAEAL
jgi:hypothetical protein